MELFTLFLFFGAMVGLAVMVVVADVAANRAIKAAQAAADSRSMPAKIKSLVELKAGFASEDLIDIFAAQKAIDDLNRTNPIQSSLSLTRQKANYNGTLKTIYLTKKSKLFPLIILLCIPLGFIPLILYAIIGAIVYQGATKYEELLNRFMAGKLGDQNVAKASGGLSNELNQLMDLKAKGALSEEEFQKAKSKLLSA
jgi:hypothetical protein